MNREQIIQRYMDDLCTRDEALEALRLLGEPAAEDTFDRLVRELEGRADTLSPWESEEEHRRLHAEAAALLRRINPSRPKQSVSLRLRRLAAAATVVVLLGLSVGGVFWLNRPLSPEDVVWHELAASYGEVKEFTLPDGTRVSLNACSRLSYPETFAGLAERRVRLEGQAFFAVARDEEQPFAVETAAIDVRVLGTEFDVKAYAADEIVSVNVKSGKVQVDMPDVSMRLYADEQFRYDTRFGSVDKRADKREVAAWQHGELQFDNTPLTDVIHELERTFGCDIALAPGVHFDNKITGSHHPESVESVLESLQYISGIKYRKEDGRYVIY